MADKPTYETGNVGVQFIGKPRPANKGDKVLQEMAKSPPVQQTNQ